MDFNIRDYGAVGDGVALDSPAVQSAADACLRAGGGTVVIPAGTYLCASVRLYSHTTLRVEQGARVLLCAEEAQYGGLRGDFDEPFSRDARELLGLSADAALDYMQEMFLAALRRNTDCLFFARDAEDVTLEGPGTLDGRFPLFFRDDAGSGDSYSVLFDMATPRWLRRLDVPCLRPAAFRPQLIVMENCRGVTIRELRLRDAPFFNIRILDSENIHCTDLDIETDTRCLNTDGINLAGCRNAFLRGCRIVTGDDCIALSCGECHVLRQDCENITVSDCIGVTNCNFCRIFSGIDADVCLECGIGDQRQIEAARRQRVRNVCISNCVLERGGCAFNIIGVYGSVEHIHIRNVRAWQAGKDAAVFLAIQKEGRVRDVTIDGLSCRARGIATIAGTDRASIDGVTFRGCDFLIEPVSKLFGNGLPDPLTRYWVSDLAPYNFYLRHASRIRITDCSVEWGEADIGDIFEIGDAAKRPAEYNDQWRPEMDPRDSWPCVDARDVDGLILRDLRCRGFGGAEAIRVTETDGLCVSQ